MRTREAEGFRFPRRMRGLMPRFMAAFLCVTLGVIVASALLLHQASHRFLLDQVEEHLKRESYLLLKVLLAALPPETGAAAAALQDEVTRLGQMTDLRITLIAPYGTVLADSDSDPGTLDNHRDRPGVATALLGGMGRAIRFSSTLNSNLLYLAFPIGEAEPTGVLRTALPIASVEESLQRVRSVLLRLSLATLAAAGLFALLFSRHVVRSGSPGAFGSGGAFSRS